MSEILSDVIASLGHQAPAVRKGALDVLRVYLNHTPYPDSVLRSIVKQGLERSTIVDTGTSISATNAPHGNVTVGLILSLPSLIFPSYTQNEINNQRNESTPYPSARFVVHSLLKKLIQVTHQEVVVLTLVKIRDLIGQATFDQYLEEFQPNYKQDFELICQVYNVNAFNGPSGTHYHNGIHSSINNNDDNVGLGHDNNLSELNQPNNAGKIMFMAVQSDNRAQHDGTDDEEISKALVPFYTNNTPSTNTDELNDAKIILTTEIQINPATALTMTISEKEAVNKRYETAMLSTDDSEEELRNHRAAVVRIFTEDDDSEPDDYDYNHRRTPRRVRFGGEIVKLRTPDSDTVIYSDNNNNESNYEDDDRDDDNDDVIQITVSTTTNNQLSVPKRFISNHLNKSLIPLPVFPATRIPLHNSKFSKTRASSSVPSSPTRNAPLISHGGQSHIHRNKRLIYQSHPDLTRKYLTNSKNVTRKAFKKSLQPETHSPLQIMYNLTSPNSQKLKEKNPSYLVSTNGVTNSVSMEVHTDDAASWGTKTVTSFSDDGESSMTSGGSSSSDHNQMLGLEKSWQDLNLIDSTIITDISNKDDWQKRVRGREALLHVFLRSRDILLSIEPRAASLLHMLLATEKDERVAKANQQLLHMAIDTFAVDTLRARLPQLAAGLARLGGPSSVMLTIHLMKKLTPAVVAEQFVNNTVLGSRSAHVRENALQIVTFTTQKFPSTEFNVAQLASRIGAASADRKKRIRQATLEALAVLAQISSMDLILDALDTALNNNIIENIDNEDDKIALITAIKTRLSRRQLPIASDDYTITYVNLGESGNGPLKETPADLAWICRGRGSLSPGSARARHRTSDLINNPWKSEHFHHHHHHHHHRPNITDPAQWRLLRSWTEDSYEDEITPAKMTSAQVWALEHQLQQQNATMRSRNNLNSSTNGIQNRVSMAPNSNNSIYNGSVRPLYILQTESTEIPGQTGFPPLVVDQNDRVFAEIIKTPKSSYNNNNQVYQNYSQSVYSNGHSKGSLNDVGSISSGSLDSTGTEYRSSKDYLRRTNLTSGIPVPLKRTPSNSMRNGRYTKSDIVPVTYSTRPSNDKTKIVSASAVSTRAASRQITPRPTFSSESRLFYNTPPAEPYYLPPIENPTTVPSSVSTPPAINPTTPTSFKESTPNTPRSATSTIHLSNINGDSNSTKSLPLNFDETPIRVNPKNQEEKIIKATEFSDWNSTPQQSVDDNLSLDRFSVKQSSEDRDESFANQRMNFSAPAQADVQSIKSHESRLDSEENVDEPDLGSNNFVGIKSLPGSIVNLNSQIELETKPIVNLQRQKSLHVSSTTPRVSKQNLGKLRGRIPPPLSNRPQIQPLGVDINSNIGYNVKPFDRPKEALNLTLQQFESNEWETIMTALRNLIRLLRNHYDIVEIQMHTVAVALAKQIRNLRSQVARAACAVASEMFGVHKKSIEMEMEELAIPLLNRTADTNKFLRSDANAALDTMVLNMPSTRVVQILATKGATHQNAIVRCATARLLFNIVNRLGVEKIFLLPRETRDRVLLTGANLLTEGSLDTRNYAKQLFRTLLPYYNFQRIMLEVIPTSTMRNISKTLNSLKS